MRYCIQGGKVYDGTGAEPRKADVLIENDRIVEVRPGLDVTEAEIIDVSGKVVTPGFIDMHRHCDIAALTDSQFGLLELSQGITTTIAGNCGLAPVPVNPSRRKESYDFIEPVVGEIPEGLFFANYIDYFDALRSARLPINMGILAGVGAVKTAVKGFGSSPYTNEELRKAIGYMRQAIEQGAFGASLGIMYEPECFSTPEEMAQVIAPATEVGGLLCTHIRGEGDSLLDSVNEVIDVAERAGIRLNISHFKATGIHNWRTQIHRAIERIEQARATGQQITADFYPYTGGATTLLSLIPPNISAGGISALLEKLSTKEGKERLKQEIYKTHSGWDNMALSIGWKRILIASVHLPEHASYGGRDIETLSSENKYSDPSDFICDLLVSEGGKVGIVVLSMSQEDVDQVSRLPYTAVISDGLYGGGSNPHPRLYGAFPKVIREYVLERGVLPLEQAIHKMTGLPAAIAGLNKRGLLSPGYYADINIFDPAKLRDNAVYTDSKQLSSGMEWVFINGRPVYRNSEKLPQQMGALLQRFNL